MDRDINALSLWDSEGSNDDQGSRSFNTEFSSLYLHSSLDSNKSGRSDKISRGKPPMGKSNFTNQTRQKKKPTSEIVLSTISNLDSTPSSGYFSLSPTSETEISNNNSVENSTMCSNNMVFNDNVKCTKKSKHERNHQKLRHK